MEATLTELRRDTSRVIRAVYRGEEIILTEHQTPIARILPFIPMRVADNPSDALSASLSDDSIRESVHAAREDYAEDIHLATVGTSTPL